MKPDFKKRGGLIVAIVQDSTTSEVLMQAYMNPEAWEKTLETREAYFWSTSKNKLWRKGDTSGNIMDVKDLYLDCDHDCAVLLVEVRGDGMACHKGTRTCFSIVS